MEGQATIARHPPRTMRMIEKAADERPGLSSVARFEKRSGFRPAIKHIGLLRRTQGNLPDVPQRNPGTSGKPDRRLFRGAPRLSKIIARAQHRTPQHAMRRDPEPVTPVAAIKRESVNGFAMEVRSTGFPSRPRRRRAQQEGSLCGADKQQGLAGLNA